MPNSWTNFEGRTLDWTNELQLHSTGDVLESVRLAVVEKCLSSSTTIPTQLQNPVQLYRTYDCTDAIQNIITTLIPKFANHTDNSGEWDGKTVIPTWTESTLLASIGAPARLTANRLQGIGLWAKQQYLILNKLRWVLLKNPKVFSPTPYSGLRCELYVRTRSGAADLPTSIADLITKNFTFSSYWPDYFIGAFAGARYWSDGASEEWKMRYLFPVIGDLQYSLVWYGMPGQGWGNTTNTYFRINDAPPVALAPPGYDYRLKFWKYGVSSEASSHTMDTYTLNLGWETVNRALPASANVESFMVASYDYYSWSQMIVKFDGPNGFKYKDW